MLRRAEVAQDNILKVYLSTVRRPVLEYAVPVWEAILGYLFDVVKRVQLRALRIIYPEALGNSKHNKTRSAFFWESLSGKSNAAIRPACKF